MRRHLFSMFRDEKGQGVIEYALIVSFAATVAVASVATFGNPRDLISPIFSVKCSPDVEPSRRIAECPLSVLFSSAPSAPKY